MRKLVIAIAFIVITAQACSIANDLTSIANQLSVKSKACEVQRT